MKAVIYACLLAAAACTPQKPPANLQFTLDDMAYVACWRAVAASIAVFNLFDPRPHVDACVAESVKSKDVVGTVDKHKQAYFKALGETATYLLTRPLFSYGCPASTKTTTTTCVNTLDLSNQFSRAINYIQLENILRTSCPDKPCSDAKSCGTNGWCPCPTGFTGLNCAADIAALIADTVKMTQALRLYGPGQAHWGNVKRQVGQPHYGTCTYKDSTDGGKTGSYGTCTCQSGWTGPACDISLALEDSVSCLNNKSACGSYGMCDSTNGKCYCKDGYTGALCQYTIVKDGCAAPNGKTGCSSHGICTKEAGCVCSGNSTGTYCGTTSHF